MNGLKATHMLQQFFYKLKEPKKSTTLLLTLLTTFQSSDQNIVNKVSTSDRRRAVLSMQRACQTF